MQNKYSVVSTTFYEILYCNRIFITNDYIFGNLIRIITTIIIPTPVTVIIWKLVPLVLIYIRKRDIKNLKICI